MEGQDHLSFFYTLLMTTKYLFFPCIRAYAESYLFPIQYPYEELFDPLPEIPSKNLYVHKYNFLLT